MGKKDLSKSCIYAQANIFISTVSHIISSLQRVHLSILVTQQHTNISWRGDNYKILSMLIRILHQMHQFYNLKVIALERNYCMKNPYTYCTLFIYS